ncbi:MAG: serine hydrolase domain-containing protein [Chrysiogenia bacterium]
MNSMRKIVLFFAIAACFGLAAPGKEKFEFPSTPQGQRAAAYFSAFNSGSDQAMAAFLKENFSAESLKRVSMDERLARFHGFREQARSLRPEKLLRAAGEKVSFLVRDGQGETLEFTFQFEKNDDARITTIMAAPVDAEAAVDLAGPPLGREEVLSRIRAELDERSQADIFSGVVLVAHDDQVIIHEARGLSSMEYSVANRPDTRFNLGSINKLFTRVAIGQLAEKGKLSLEDKIEKFLPDYPNREAAQKVSVRQLLDMSSGIGDFFGDKYRRLPKDRIRDLPDYLELFASEPLLFQPGSSRRYSNGGYIVLGLIVAKASGQSYWDYVRDHIYIPAGMTATGHLDADVPAANVAGGYTRNWDEGDHEKEPRRSNIYTRPARGSSAGGGYSTALDLFKFSLALRAGKLLGPLGKEWFGGPQAYAGGAPGINAELDMDAAPGWTVVVMGNYDPPAASSLAQKISGLLRRLR